MLLEELLGGLGLLSGKLGSARFRRNCHARTFSRICAELQVDAPPAHVFVACGVCGRSAQSQLRKAIDMKIGLHVFFASLVAAALLVPAAAAKPGNGNGNGHGQGPPAWASGGSGGAKAHGKPASAGKGQEKKAEKAAQREARRAARAAADEATADAPKHDNPAWVCKFEREQMGVEAFPLGTARTRRRRMRSASASRPKRTTGTGPATDGEAPPAAEPEEGDPSDQPVVGGEESVAADAFAALRAFFNALTGLVF